MNASCGVVYQTIVRVKLFITVCVALLSCASCVYLDHNFREVEPDRMYRSGQMPDHRLGRFIKAHDIGTVVNLRGESPDEDWYTDEVAVCAGLNVTHYDLDWSMKRMPSPESLAQLIEIYDGADGPVLAHCQGGTHRAAVAAAVFRLLDGDSVEDARDEFGLFFNDAPIGELLTLYEKDGGDFRVWAVEEYPEVYANAEGS